MRRTIPAPVIAIVADIVSTREGHATLDSLFMHAGAPGDPPPGSRHAKALEWLRRVNKDDTVEPLEVLGRIVEGYLDAALDPDNSWDAQLIESNEKIHKTLARCDLKYFKGGQISGSVGAPTRTLADYIRERDLPAVDLEFDRALQNVDANPREAASAASNILESVCKALIHERALELPQKQDLQGLWNVVRKELGFDPGRLEDDDLKQILSGLISIVQGLGALRTHASSAHGAGPKGYKLQPRHARLAVHAAHTAALFVLESWDQRK